MRRPDLDDPDLPLSELFAEWPEAMRAFLERRMLCPGCPIGPFHTITDACAEYGLDEAAFRQELSRRIEGCATTRTPKRRKRRGPVYP